MATLMEPGAVETEFFPKSTSSKFKYQTRVQHVVKSDSDTLKTTGSGTMIFEEESRQDIEAVYEHQNTSFEFSETDNHTAASNTTDTTIFPDCTATAAARYFGFPGGCVTEEDDSTLPSGKGQKTPDKYKNIKNQGDNMSSGGLPENDQFETDSNDDSHSNNPKTSYFSRLLENNSTDYRQNIRNQCKKASVSARDNASRIEQVLSETESFDNATDANDPNDETDDEKKSSISSTSQSVRDTVVASMSSGQFKKNQLKSDHEDMTKHDTVAHGSCDELTIPHPRNITNLYSKESIGKDYENGHPSKVVPALQVYDPLAVQQETSTKHKAEKSKHSGFLHRLRISRLQTRRKKKTPTIQGSQGSFVMDKSHHAVRSKQSRLSPPSSPTDRSITSRSLLSTGLQNTSVTSSSNGIQSALQKSTTVQRIEPKVEPASDVEKEIPSPRKSESSIDLPNLSETSNSFMQFIASQSSFFGLTVVQDEQLESSASGGGPPDESSKQAAVSREDAFSWTNLENEKKDDLEVTISRIETDNSLSKSKDPTFYLRSPETPGEPKDFFNDEEREDTREPVSSDMNHGDVQRSDFLKNATVTNEGCNGLTETCQGICSAEPLDGKLTNHKNVLSESSPQPPFVPFHNETSVDECETQKKKETNIGNRRNDVAQDPLPTIKSNRQMAQNSKLNRSQSRVEWVYKAPTIGSAKKKSYSSDRLIPTKQRNLIRNSENKSVSTRCTYKTKETSMSRSLEPALSFNSEQSSVLFQAHDCCHPVPKSSLPRSIITKRNNIDGLVVLKDNKESRISRDAVPEGVFRAVVPLEKKESVNNTKASSRLLKQSTGGQRASNLAKKRTGPVLAKALNQTSLIATLTNEEDSTLASHTVNDGYNDACCAYEVVVDDDITSQSGSEEGATRRPLNTCESDSVHEDLTGKTLALAMNGRDALADDLTELSFLSKSTAGISTNTSTVDDSGTLDKSDQREMTTVSPSLYRRIEYDKNRQHLDVIAEDDRQIPVSTDPLFRLLGANRKDKKLNKRRGYPGKRMTRLRTVSSQQESDDLFCMLQAPREGTQSNIPQI